MLVTKSYKAPIITHSYQVPYPINDQASQPFHGYGLFGVHSVIDNTVVAMGRIVGDGALNFEVVERDKNYTFVS